MDCGFEGGFHWYRRHPRYRSPQSVMTFRVDMDALDLSEEQDVSHRPYRDIFASCNAGMMHACGHDGHTAIGLRAGAYLKQFGVRTTWRHQTDFSACRGRYAWRGRWSMQVVVDDVDYFYCRAHCTGVPAGTVKCAAVIILWQPPNLTRTSPVPPLRRRKTRRRSTMPCWRHSHSTCTACNRPASEGPARVNVGVMQAGSGRNVVPASALLKVETRGPATSLINMF